MTQRKQPVLLAVYAHPDDEILGAGGTLALAAERGATVAIVVATRGEAGEIQRPGTATPETLPEVREEEMRCSARTLGISELIFLDYRDSGMPGTLENEHPDAFVNAEASDVQQRLAAIIERLCPDVIITFEPFGGYGHPDHQAINRHTLAALNSLDLSHGSTPRVFYHLLPRSLFKEMKRRVAAHGGDTSGYDEMIEDAAGDRWPDDQIHATIDVSSAIDKKWDAWNCHRTQFGPSSRFRRLPDDEMKKLLSTEYFALARPLPGPDTHLTNLFAPIDSTST